MTRTLAQTMVETNPGTLLAGKYRVERVLGTGGMGVVVAAVHEGLDERVAIKLLRADRLAQKDAVERALREARATVKIQSEHVVRVFDVGTLESGAPYIVMEYLAGCDLAQLLCAEGRLDIADAAAYVKQACDAVAKAHAIGIVHRDLKPANLFLAVRDDVSAIKVLDFGISKFVTTDPQARVDPSLTATASVLGSPAYMSPEQLESPRDIDGRTDVWSLGVILFELLTGAHPFVADTLPQLYKKIAEAPAPSVRSIRPDIPVDLDAIVARCLEKKSDRRFAEVKQLADALAPFAHDSAGRRVIGLAETAAASREEFESARLGSKISGSPPSGLEAAGAGMPAGLDAPRAGIAMAVERTQVRRRRMLLGSLATAGLAIAASGALVCVHADSSRGSPSRVAGGAAGNANAAGLAGSTLAHAASVLACPQLTAKGVEKPEGWLGATAASIVCTRAMARMGGRSERTLLPAELLELPRTLVDQFPEDAYSAEDARDRQVAAAKTRGDAWIDGEIEHSADRFTVTLVLRAGDREIARGTSQDPTLVTAIHGAMQPIDAFIPAAKDDDPFLREWYGARTPDAAVAVIEHAISNRLEWPDKTGCDALLASPDIVPISKQAIKTACIPESPDLPARDTSSPGALVASIEADGQLAKRPLEPEIARLDKALAATTDHQARSFLLATKANVLSMHRDYAGATQVALSAVNESADAFYPWTTGWIVLVWVRANSNAAPAALAWNPWNAEVYCFAATRAGKTATEVQYMRRNTVISHAGIWKSTLVEFLIHAGKLDEARAVAATLPNDPVNARVDAGDGQFAHAMAQAEDLMVSDDPYAATSAAVVAADLGSLVGRPVKGLDKVVKKFLDDKPEMLENNPLVEIQFGIACTTAPRALAQHCFKRLRDLTGGIVFFEPNFLEGAEKYSQGDYRGAAHAWRALVAHPDWHQVFLHDLLADAFERGGDPDNATRIDARFLDDGQFNGAEPAHVREALRAEKRGDTARARELAKKVIAAWSVADTDVPAVAEMRKLVTRLDRRDREQHDHTR